MDDPVLEEEFRCLKKRDLFQTYFFKMACRAFGPPAYRERLTVAPPMPKFTVPVRCEGRKGPLAVAESSRTGQDLGVQSYTGDGGPELGGWIRERKLLRRELEQLGELDGWLHRKPTLTEIESLVMDRKRATRKTPAPSQLRHDMARVQGGMQDEEVLSSLQTLGTDSGTHSYWSTLGGPTGRAVEHFKKRCQGEYLDSLEHCQRHKLPISQDTLQRAYLHPGDVSVLKELALRQESSSAVPGYRGPVRGQVSYRIPPREGKEKEVDGNGKNISTSKKMGRRQHFTWRADPNAFWPGHEDHVRLYQPVMSNRPESVHFHLVKHTPVPSPGHWPVNQAGYYTSGDYNRHKAYSL